VVDASIIRTKKLFEKMKYREAGQIFNGLAKNKDKETIKYVVA
jgi:hypothetical protein